MKLYNFIFFVSIFTTYACSDVIDVELSKNNKLSLECIIAPNQEITATLSTASNFANVSDIYYPKNAKIYLLTNIDAPIEFVYDEERRLYYVPPRIHVPISSFRYEIRAHLKDDPDYEVFGKTVFKQGGVITKADNIKISTTKSEDRVKLSVALDYKPFGTHFARIIPYYRTYEVVNSDTIFSDYLPYTFEGVEENPLAFHNGISTRGILADLERVELHPFTMNLSRPDLSDVESKLYLYTEYITEETYRYELSKSRQIEAINSSSQEPVITFTNINGGFGVFGSQLPTMFSIPLD